MWSLTEMLVTLSIHCIVILDWNMWKTCFSSPRFIERPGRQKIAKINKKLRVLVVNASCTVIFYIDNVSASYLCTRFFWRLHTDSIESRKIKNIDGQRFEMMKYGRAKMTAMTLSFLAHQQKTRSICWNLMSCSQANTAKCRQSWNPEHMQVYVPAYILRDQNLYTTTLQENEVQFKH